MPILCSNHRCTLLKIRGAGGRSKCFLNPCGFSVLFGQNIKGIKHYGVNCSSTNKFKKNLSYIFHPPYLLTPSDLQPTVMLKRLGFTYPQSVPLLMSGGQLLKIQLLDNHLLDTFGRKSIARHKIYQLLESGWARINWIRAVDKKSQFFTYRNGQ